MRRFGLVLSFLLLFSAGAWAADAWSTFHDPAGLFTVDLPAKPAVDNPSVPGSDGKPVQSVEYTVDLGNSAMLVMIGDFTRFADTSAVLDAAVKGAGKRAAKDLAENPVTIDGRIGTEVTFADSDGNRFDDLVFLVDKRLYQVMSVLTSDASPTAVAGVGRFKTSFHFASGQ